MGGVVDACFLAVAAAEGDGHCTGRQLPGQRALHLAFDNALLHRLMLEVRVAANGVADSIGADLAVAEGVRRDAARLRRGVTEHEGRAGEGGAASDGAQGQA